MEYHVIYRLNGEISLYSCYFTQPLEPEIFNHVPFWKQHLQEHTGEPMEGDFSLVLVTGGSLQLNLFGKPERDMIHSAPTMGKILLDTYNTVEAYLMMDCPY